MPSGANDNLEESASRNRNAPLCLVLLGASNLAFGWSALSRQMKACLHSRKVDVLVAAGPGRGYHVPAGLLNAIYPPINACHIFEAVQEKWESGYRVMALVTDIGNDIMYGVSAEELIDTIQRILNRLLAINAEVFYTPLPVAFEKSVHPLKFYILRTLYLPFSRVPYDVAVGAIIRVNQFLKETASRDCYLISNMDRYLGYDEIHYGWWHAPLAWSHVARCMLEVMNITPDRDITRSAMLKSYWEEARQLLWSDIAGIKMKYPGHF